MATTRSVRAQFNQQNEACARIIAGDPVRYPAGSGAALWARLFLERLERERMAAAGPLFAVSAFESGK